MVASSYIGVVDLTGLCQNSLQGKYRLGRKIGSGSFGDIYIGENTISPCAPHICSRNPPSSSQLFRNPPPHRRRGGNKVRVHQNKASTAPL